MLSRRPLHRERVGHPAARYRCPTQLEQLAVRVDQLDRSRTPPRVMREGPRTTEVYAVQSSTNAEGLLMGNLSEDQHETQGDDETEGDHRRRRPSLSRRCRRRPGQAHSVAVSHATSPVWRSQRIVVPRSYPFPGPARHGRRDLHDEEHQRQDDRPPERERDSTREPLPVMTRISMSGAVESGNARSAIAVRTRGRRETVELADRAGGHPRLPTPRSARHPGQHGERAAPRTDR